MKKLLAIITTVCALASSALAQTVFEGTVEADRTIFDFGDLVLGSGAAECTFTFKNISDKPISIYNVVSSCGCAVAEWTRESIAAGGKGIVKAKYLNEDGPYPFDKTFTVYISSLKTPVILRIRGIVREKARPLSETYPIHLGGLGIRSLETKVGNLSQGEKKSGEIRVANISSKPIRVTFEKVSKNFSVRSEPETIPANSTGVLVYTVTASRELWGRNYYKATVVVDGKARKELSFQAFTKENFSGMSRQEQMSGPLPYFENSTFSFGKVKSGTEIKASFSLTNKGKKDLVIYKVDTDAVKLKCIQKPGILKPGEKGVFIFSYDTSGLPLGQVSAYATLTSNSPMRPFLDLFLEGEIK